MSWMQTAICLIRDLFCFVLFLMQVDRESERERERMKHFSRDASMCFAPRLENYINPPLRWLQVLSFLSLHHSHQQTHSLSFSLRHIRFLSLFTLF
ncbi:hypothetical protein H0G86_007982 [Trichoderma simmonsii]|uniref:Secreted protein n=1 Tax=Trichoderma simmonsii TaxID=1491479 RepID=A0A8G0LGK3_9HYPO|nr:hypothetical protein H0G86_007982 [Trichoderma simmonsii]